MDGLTGFADGPALVPPEGLLAAIRRLGKTAGIDDALPLLRHRSDITGSMRNGRTSCGGSSRLLRASDHWVAVSLARHEDVDLVPAWLGGPELEERLARVPAVDAVARGRMLGLPVAALGERSVTTVARATRLGDAPPLTRPPLVVDLSSLWAGPLCTRILLARGARVVKVESTTRPDGARHGPPEFFELLNAGKECVSIDFTAADLSTLLLTADVVVEGSRPRALEQLGIDAAAVVRDGPQVWLSITAHGRTGPQRDWVGFGDDTAVAGGLVAWWRDEPCFVADAIADPLTGVAGAGAVMDALRRGGRWLIDCNLADVSAHVAAAALGDPWVPAA
ncbi:MAG: hypothetical protein QOG87_1859 [Actinomycetota bacterium]|jgi:hypothetical protein